WAHVQHALGRDEQVGATSTAVELAEVALVRSTKDDGLPALLAHPGERIVDGGVDRADGKGVAPLEPAHRDQGHVEGEVGTRGEIFEPHDRLETTARWSRPRSSSPAQAAQRVSVSPTAAASSRSSTAWRKAARLMVVTCATPRSSHKPPRCRAL